MLASRTTIAIPPGETILEQLEYYNMNRDEFAEKMNMSRAETDSLLSGERVLSAETAARLEAVLGVPARFWSGLEAHYREDIERIKRENTARHSRLEGTVSRHGDTLAPVRSVW